eukprot:COSAG01_NODE_2802_length_7049_cov_2.441871_3_plen_167_part_00
MLRRWQVRCMQQHGWASRCIRCTRRSREMRGVFAVHRGVLADLERSRSLHIHPWPRGTQVSQASGAHAPMLGTPRRPIDAPCTPCLRHGDPVRAKKRLTVARLAGPRISGGAAHPRRPSHRARRAGDVRPAQRGAVEAPHILEVAVHLPPRPPPWCSDIIHTPPPR